MNFKPEHEIFLYICWEEIEDLEKLGKKIFQITDESYLEKPNYLKIPGHKDTKPINHYLDEKIIKYYLKKGTIETCTNADTVTFNLGYYEQCVTLGIFYYPPQNKEAIELLKGLFFKLITIEQPYNASVHLEKQKQKLKIKYETFNRWKAKEHVRSRGLYWLNFWGPEELRRQGGKVEVEKNPYARCTPMMDGLLIEVGENPFDLLTPEGEELLMKATGALPEIELMSPPE